MRTNEENERFFPGYSLTAGQFVELFCCSSKRLELISIALKKLSNPSSYQRSKKKEKKKEKKRNKKKKIEMKREQNRRNNLESMDRKSANFIGERLFKALSLTFDNK